MISPTGTERRRKIEGEDGNELGLLQGLDMGNRNIRDYVATG